MKDWVLGDVFREEEEEKCKMLLTFEI